MTRKQFTVKGRQQGLRLFEVIATELDTSRKKAQAALDARRVLVNGKRIWMKNHIVHEDDRIEVFVEAQERKVPRRIAILWQDEDYLIINKPAFLLTNAADDSVEAMLRKQEGSRDICAVHRLDRETTGCVLFARSAAAKRGAIPLFKGRDIMKIYRAVTIGRLPRNWKEIRTDIDGYIAATLVKTLDSNRHASYLELRIETGRTHQIRRQLADKRHPVMGDKQYAGTGNEWSVLQPRQMLHAYRLIFTHPGSGRTIRATAPLPGDFKRCLSQLKLR
jgi:23S rRNA pseudouridine1911/1915/1917 synthase